MRTHCSEKPDTCGFSLTFLFYSDLFMAFNYFLQKRSFIYAPLNLKKDV